MYVLFLEAYIRLFPRNESESCMYRVFFFSLLKTYLRIRIAKFEYSYFRTQFSLPPFSLFNFNCFFLFISRFSIPFFKSIKQYEPSFFSFPFLFSSALVLLQKTKKKINDIEILIILCLFLLEKKMRGILEEKRDWFEKK